LTEKADTGAKKDYIEICVMERGKERERVCVEKVMEEVCRRKNK
jgi:hypothetical protein